MFFGLVPNSNASNPGAVPNDPFDDWKAGTLGMSIFLIIVGILFISSILAYVILRTQADVKPPDLPALTWLSTFIILLSSWTMQCALWAAKRENAHRAIYWQLIWTTLLGLAFIAVQVVAWVQVWNQIDFPDVADAAGGISLYETDEATQRARSIRFVYGMFLVLSVLHALHVVGGLVPLLLATRAAAQRRYHPRYHPGVAYTTMYWHFLGVIWVVLFAVLAWT